MHIFILMAGSVFLAFGVLVVFSRKFLVFLHQTLWKSGELDKRFFTEKSGYYYNKYIRGIGCIVFGLILISLAIFMLK